jgi:hypothetical protein
VREEDRQRIERGSPEPIVDVVILVALAVGAIALLAFIVFGVIA